MTDGDGKGGDKGGGKGKAKAPKLPKDAPKEVKDFLSCKTDTLELDPTKKGWIPDLPLVGAPDVKIEPGAKAGTAKVTLSKGGDTIGVKYSFDVSVKDGHLDVDTSKVDTAVVKDGIDAWVKNYNDWLDAKGRKLDGITVKDGKATIKKAPKADGHTSIPGGKLLVAGVATVALVGGGYVAYQATQDDGGTNTVTASDEPVQPDDGVTGDGNYNAGGDPNAGGALSGFDTDDVVGVGVQITHDGSAPDAADGQVGLSQGEVVVVTTWDDLIQLAAQCGDRTSTAEGQADADGILRLDLALFEMVPCEFTSFKLRDGDHWSDGQPVEFLDLGTGFDVGPNEVLVTDPQIDAALAQLEGGAPPAPETVESFLAELGDSLASDDPSFAIDRLHPTVLSAFPTQCPAHVQATADPTWNFEVVDVGSPMSYVYAPPSLGGVQYTVPNVITVSARVTSDGTTAPADVHVADVDGTYRWFTDCGGP